MPLLIRWLVLSLASASIAPAARAESIAPAARAETAAPSALAAAPVEQEKPLHAYVCRFEGELKGLRLGFGLSAQFLGGRGNISCIAPATGRHYHLPVRYRLLGAGPGYDLTWVRHVKV